MGTTNIIQFHDLEPDEFRNQIINDLKSELYAALENIQQSKQIPVFLTRKEVASLLKVTVVTLIDWDKKGLLKPYRIGNLIRYKRSEIEESLLSKY